MYPLNGMVSLKICGRSSAILCAMVYERVCGRVVYGEKCEDLLDLLAGTYVFEIVGEKRARERNSLLVVHQPFLWLFFQTEGPRKMYGDITEHDHS